MPPNRNVTHRNLVSEGSQGALPTLAPTREFFGSRQVNMASSKKLTEVSINHQDNGEWLETTPGERFTIRTSSKETEAIYTALEVVADPRTGVPIHIHNNQARHLLLLHGPV